MRVVNRNFHKVYFIKADDTPLLFRTVKGDSIVTWNTQKRAIAAKITTPLPIIVTPDEWSQMRRASIEADSWLVGEHVTDEMYFE